MMPTHSAKSAWSHAFAADLWPGATEPATGPQREDEEKEVRLEPRRARAISGERRPASRSEDADTGTV